MPQGWLRGSLTESTTSSVFDAGGDGFDVAKLRSLEKWAQPILKEVEAEFCVVAWENRKMTRPIKEEMMVEPRVKDRVGAKHFSPCPTCGEPISMEEQCQECCENELDLMKREQDD